MTTIRELVARIRGTLGRPAPDEALEDELQAHLEFLVDENMERGMAPGEARRAARLTLGGDAQIKEAWRDQRGFPWLEDLQQDWRYALRSLLANRAFAAVALLTLALGTGANTAVFSVLYAAWLAPLNYADPGQLVEVGVRTLANPSQGGGTSWPNLVEWRAANHVFSGLGVYHFVERVNLTGAGAPEETLAARVSADLFPLLGVAPALGRGFDASQDLAGGARSALVSDAYWRARFGADPNVAGRSIVVDGEPFTVAGVMPAGFEFPPGSTAQRTPVWLSLNLTAEARAERGPHALYVVGRLKQGVSLAQAQAEMATISAAQASAYPAENGGEGAWVTGLAETRSLVAMKPALLMMMIAAGLVLLIACANVAGLLLVRGAARRREFAIRLALGVSRARLARQLLTESLVLGLIGGALGLGLAAVGMDVIRAMLPVSMPRVTGAGLQPAVLIFSAVCAAGAAMVSGLAPALSAGRVSIEQALRQSARTMASPNRVARGLVAFEVALAVTLLAAGGLLVESFRRVSRVELGFDREHVLTARLQLPRWKYGTAERVMEFRRRLLQTVKQAPGVVAAGTVGTMPLGDISAGADYQLEERQVRPAPSANFGKVSADYMLAMAIHLRRGRYFNEADTGGQTKAVIVSESVARRHWPAGGALGRRIRLKPDENAEWYTVVGVVDDVRELSADRAPDGTIYALYDQLPEREQRNLTSRINVLAVRTAGDPSQAAELVRRAVREVDPDQPVSDVMTTEQLLDRSIAGRKLNAFLIGAFSLLAIVLAAIGLFGVVAYSVAGRTNEIGIRVALGASSGSVAWLVVRDSATIAGAGLLAGLVGAAGAGRLLERFLYGVKVGDGTVAGVTAAMVFVTACLATLVPLRRALSVDPMTALREE